MLSNLSETSRFGLGLALCAGLALRAHADDDPRRYFSLTLPVEWPAGAELAVELDGYDITAFVQLNGRQLDVQMGTPLEQGAHQVSVLAFMTNGDIETLLDQPLLVGTSAGRHSSWQLSSAPDSSYRIAEKDNGEFDPVPELAGQGAIALRGLEQIGQWQFDSELDALYDSVSENHEGDNEWALPHYKLGARYSGENASAGVAVGNILVPRDDLLFSVFQRRGAALSLAAQSGSYDLTLFELSSDPNTRYDNGLLFPGNRSLHGSGATASVALADEYLRLSGGYISGNTAFGSPGTLFADDIIEYGGDSWNLALDSHLLQRDLWLYLEYAESSFDSDGIGVGLDAERDSALQALAQFTSGEVLGSGWFDYWSGTLQYQKVGTAFYSLGNLSLPGDLELSRLLFQAGIKSVTLDLELSEEETNTGDNPFLPTQTLSRQRISTTYTPMGINPDGWPWRALGSPSLALDLNSTGHSQPQRDAQVAGFDLDMQSRDAGINLVFTQMRWNWSLQYQQTHQDDRSQAVTFGDYLVYEPASDLRNRLLGLQLGWMPNSRASFNAFMQWNKQTETDFDNHHRSRNLGGDGTVQLWPERLTLAFSYNYGADRSHLGNNHLGDSSFIGNDMESHFGNAQLIWHALQAVGNSPGLDLYLKSSYGQQDNRAFALVNEQWSLHLGFTLAWAAGAQ